MDFCTALKHIRGGKVIKRQGVDMSTQKTFWYYLYLDIEYLKFNPVARDAYFFPIKYKNEFCDIVFDWQPLQSDLFALDWQIAKVVRKKLAPKMEIEKENVEVINE